eukprot:TRINITY_DN8871_c0_g1_i1.p1 TRINITY_DN8871_c0_g1~~TRINITY_DN8871_c0_g1_i1.p1  ORF type:complete len:388 (-),score=115.55 TRINITY_DN8871_c0_g1_i1:42-1205(-)
MAEVSNETAVGSGPGGADGADLAEKLVAALAKMTALKEEGNAALKSADLPRAVEKYEQAAALWEDAMRFSPQPKVLKINDPVISTDGDWATVDIAYPHFGDYVLESQASKQVIKHKVSKYEEVPKRFARKDVRLVPKELYDLRLACLQNLVLVQLKFARGSQAESDWQKVLERAQDALFMNGRSAKALMRMGIAFLALKKVQDAYQALTLAKQETKGKDPEVMDLLGHIEEALEKSKGKKGKGKGKGKGKNFASTYNRSCAHPDCDDEGCKLPSDESSTEEEDEPSELAGRPDVAEDKLSGDDAGQPAASKVENGSLNDQRDESALQREPNCEPAEDKADEPQPQSQGASGSASVLLPVILPAALLAAGAGWWLLSRGSGSVGEAEL